MDQFLFQGNIIMLILNLINRKKLEELEKFFKLINDNLRQLFVDIDMIIIKEGGVYNDKVMLDEIVLILGGQDKVK